MYVGQREFPYGGMLMSHMASPDLTELHAMASDLDLKREWFQETDKRGGISHPHYDLCKSKKLKAIKLGAIEICDKELIRRCYGEVNEQAAAEPVGYQETITTSDITIFWDGEFYKIPFIVLVDEVELYGTEDRSKERYFVYSLSPSGNVEKKVEDFKVLFADIMPSMAAYKLPKN